MDDGHEYDGNWEDNWGIEPVTIVLQDEWAQLARRLAAQAGKTTEQMVGFCLVHMNTLMEMEPGQTIEIRKKIGESQLTISDVLGHPSSSGDGLATGEQGGD